MKKLLLIGDKLDINGRAAMAGRTRIKLSWSKWRELRGIPTNKAGGDGIEVDGKHSRNM